jgi:hypothetical protein
MVYKSLFIHFFLSVTLNLPLLCFDLPDNWPDIPEIRGQRSTNVYTAPAERSIVDEDTWL